MRDTFIYALESFGVSFFISYETKNTILAQVHFSNFFTPHEVEDLHDWVAHELGIPVFDVILEENRDGVQVGVDYQFAGGKNY
tara:strand:+ start:3016 stop:3264 length:249 start_codon:yes stop_codon:yes gene_type:complete